MTKIICDRCGTDMTQSGAFGRIEMKIYQRQDFIGDPVHRMIDGSSSVPQIDSGAVMAAVQTVKGIGVKRLAQIEAAVSALFSTGNGGAADGSRN